MAEDAKKLVWIQLAQTGTFKGHPQGPFEITPQTFDSVCKNFKHDGLPIAIDAEHASEMPPTSGDISVNGAPAMGWIHGLDNRGNGGLWGHVEWLEPARSYIKEGRYKFLSPALRFKSKDRVTGEQTGPRLSSAAITNSPFLPNMKPLTASARAADGEAVHVMSLALAEDIAAASETAVPMSLNTMCYSAHEYMPQVKSALGMHELSNAMDCSDRLGQLRDHLDSVAGDHTQKPEGVDLAKYLMPLRAMSNVPMGSTWDDVFDTVQGMIDSAIAQHVAEYHEGEDADDASMSTQEPASPVVPLTNAEPAAPIPDEPTTPAATEPVAESTAIVVASAPAAEAIAPITETSAPAAPAVKLATQPIPEAAIAPALTEVTTMANPASNETDTTLLNLKLQTAESELESVKAENARLLSWKEAREENDLVAEVSVAFETHKDRMKLKQEQKPDMLASLRSNPEAFRKLFPPTPLNYRHLLSTIAASERSATAPAPAPRVQADMPAPTQSAPVTMTLRTLARQLQVKKNIPLGLAQQEAERIIKAQKRAANG